MDDRNRRSVDENMERLKQAQPNSGGEGTKTAFGISGMILATLAAILIIFAIVFFVL